MAEVSIAIGGFNYQIACRDGEEAHLARLGELVAAKASEARAAVSNAGEVRQLLLAALLLADELETRSSSVAAPEQLASDHGPLLDAVAERVEAIAQRVEKLAGQP